MTNPYICLASMEACEAEVARLRRREALLKDFLRWLRDDSRTLEGVKFGAQAIMDKLSSMEAKP